MKSLIVIFSFLASCYLYGQASQSFMSSDFDSTTLKVLTTKGTYYFEGISSEIIETNFIPVKETKKWSSHITKQSLDTPKVIFHHKENILTLATNGIKVAITKKPFHISYFYKEKTLISERKGYIKTDSTEILDFTLSKNEALYGTGARALAMNRRGHKLELYNKAHYSYETNAPLMNYCMPLVISSKNYMIHFDNPQTGFLDLDSNADNSLQFETIGGAKKYQVIASDTWKKTINAYTSFTGKQPMPPRWALGNFASRFGYHSQSEVENVVEKFKKDSIPLDAVILDIYWFGKTIKRTMGNLEFDPDSFPKPQQLINDLKKDAIKTVLITEPFILETSKKWDEAVSKSILATDSLGKPYTYDFYFGKTGLIDILKPEAKTWFQNIYKKYTNMGIAGWWGDLGEPEVHPEDLFHGSVKANEIHNIYGHLWAKLIQETYRKNYPNQRPFILMRAGYSGTQAYGIIPWSGDVSRSWGGLQAQPKIALQMGMQGLGYMHSDLGGFAGGETLNPELYTRWLQYGVFQPIFRPHAQEHIAPEPIFQDANTKQLAKEAIELRYKLLPYNYTLAFENHNKGTPLMRPLFFEEPTNPSLKDYSDSYLWGNDFLVTPILKPGVNQKKIYFPKGNHWYNFYGNEKYKGGQFKTIPISNKHIPIFVKGGAFITQSEKLQNTEDYDFSNITVDFYYDESLSSSNNFVYFDDGKTPDAYEKKRYEILHYKAINKNNGCRIELKNVVGSNFKAKNKTIKLKIRNIKALPTTVTKNSSKIEFDWNKETEIVTTTIELKTNSEIVINLKK